MGQIVTQNLPADLLLVLTLTDGTPATAISHAAVQCQYRKEGDPAFNNKALTALNFKELGNGFYTVSFTAAELDIPGSFAFVVLGAGIQPSQNTAQIRSTASTLPTVPVSLPMCTITGNINDLAGNPIAGAAVSARVIGMPTIAVNVGLTDDLQTAITDDSGVFNLTIAKLAVVDVFIPRINYRRQLTVPNLETVNLFTGIP
jgi:hypothetical protein